MSPYILYNAFFWTCLIICVLAAVDSKTRVSALVDVDNDANIGAEDEYGASVLMQNAASGRLDSVLLLLEKGANINHKDKVLQFILMLNTNNHYIVLWQDGQNALMQATTNGFDEMVSLLIKRGADVNAQNSGGGTALIWAAKLAAKKILSILLEGGANVDTRDRQGKTALIWASFTSIGSEQVSQLLFTAI